MQAEQGRRRTRYYKGMLTFGSTIFVLCALTLLLTARRMVTPIRNLCKNVLAFRLTDSPSALHEKGIPCNDRSLKEIRTLATAIYSMQDAVLEQYAVEKRNEMLRAELHEEALRTANVEKQLRETQLKALQAQINPHFLFNTLNMIAQMAYIEGAEHTTELLETFSDYFRYNVESFDRSVTLAEEFNNVRGYIALQKERFGNRINYVMECDEAVNEIQVPCLILQPFVENSIVHGLRMKLEGGRIYIAVRAVAGNGFEIRIEDNGCGMEKEALEALIRQATRGEEEDSASHSIGISNVIRRLRITFGKDVSFHANSAPGEGLEIIVHVEREVST